MDEIQVELASYMVEVAKAIEGIPLTPGENPYVTEVRFGQFGDDLEWRLELNEFDTFSLVRDKGESK